MLFRRLGMGLKVRRQVALGCLCLSMGLLLRLFVHPSGNVGRNWLDGVAGMLIGMSIAINFLAFRSTRRCGGKQDITPAP